MFSGHIWSYEHIAKRIKLFRGREVTDLVPFNICSVYKVYGTQNDRLELPVSMQKSFLKICSMSRHISQNVQNYGGQVWRHDFWLILVLG